jgi:replication-associated recombination protein RarA
LKKTTEKQKGTTWQGRFGKALQHREEKFSEKEVAKDINEAVTENSSVADNKGVTSYAELLSTLKERIRASQVRAALSVNREMVLL